MAQIDIFVLGFTERRETPRMLELLLHNHKVWRLRKRREMRQAYYISFHFIS